MATGIQIFLIWESNYDRDMMYILCFDLNKFVRITHMCPVEAVNDYLSKHEDEGVIASDELHTGLAFCSHVKDQGKSMQEFKKGTTIIPVQVKVAKNDANDENITKATQTADLLLQDLRELQKTENFVLASITEDMIQTVTQVQQQLKQTETSRLPMNTIVIR